MEIEFSIYPYNFVEITRNRKGEYYQVFPYDYQLYQLSYLQVRKFTIDYTLDHVELFHQMYRVLIHTGKKGNEDSWIKEKCGGLNGALVIRQDKQIFTYTYNNSNLSKKEVYHDDFSNTNNFITFNRQFSFSSNLKGMLEDVFNKYSLVGLHPSNKKSGSLELKSHSMSIRSKKQDYDYDKYPFQCYFINNFSNEYLKEIKTDQDGRMTIEGMHPIKLHGQSLIEYLFFFKHLKDISQNNKIEELFEKIQFLNEKFDKMEKEIHKKETLIELLIEQNKMFKMKIDEIICKK